MSAATTHTRACCGCLPSTASQEPRVGSRNTHVCRWLPMRTSFLTARQPEILTNLNCTQDQNYLFTSVLEEGQKQPTQLKSYQFLNKRRIWTKELFFFLPSQKVFYYVRILTFLETKNKKLVYRCIRAAKQIRDLKSTYLYNQGYSDSVPSFP